MLLFARGMSLPRGRKPDTDDRDLRVDRLERVVRAREERRERDPRGTAAATVELRLPEARQVRLVADDELGHLRIRAGDELQPLDELVDRARRARDRARLADVDTEGEVDSLRGRPRDRAVEERLLADLERLGRIPVDRHLVGAQTGLAELREEPFAPVVVVLATVVRDAEDDRRRRRIGRVRGVGSACSGEQQCRACGCD